MPAAPARARDPPPDGQADVRALADEAEAQFGSSALAELERVRHLLAEAARATGEPWASAAAAAAAGGEAQESEGAFVFDARAREPTGFDAGVRESFVFDARVEGGAISVNSRRSRSFEQLRAKSTAVPVVESVVRVDSEPQHQPHPPENQRRQATI